MFHQPPAIGDRLGPYILEERIGQGGFGEVWRARHSVLQDKVVAAKIPTDSGYVGVLRREGILQHRLKHPSIVELLDIDIDHDPAYLVMEYVDGEDLRKRLAREGPLDLQVALSISEEILEALEAAHFAGTVHRDLKPGNVLLPREGGVKLTDFGLGSALDTSRSLLLRSRTMQSEEIDTIAGTLAYMAPEQQTGKGPIDERADIFAFGVILFEMVTGEMPIGAAIPRQIRAEVSPELDEVYRNCCAPLSHRYESVSDLLRALRALQRPRPAPWVDPFLPPRVKARPRIEKVERGVLGSELELPEPDRAGMFAGVGFLLFTVSVIVASIGVATMESGTTSGGRILLVGFVLGVFGLIFMGMSGERSDAESELSAGAKQHEHPDS